MASREIESNIHPSQADIAEAQEMFERYVRPPLNLRTGHDVAQVRRLPTDYERQVRGPKGMSRIMRALKRISLSAHTK